MVCLKCNKEFKGSQKIDGKTRNLYNRKYCLDCVPFGTRFSAEAKHCARCGKDTYKQRKLCNSCIQTVRRYIAKKTGIKLLGGKCIKCGFNKNMSALDFHHPDNNKEHLVSKIYHRKWTIVKKEIEKCELLCSNCHRIEHTGNRDEKFLEFVKHYNGKIRAV